MNSLVANTLIAVAGIVRGTLATAFSYLTTLIKSGTNSVMQFHQEGIAFAREMGMNAKEAQAYTEVLTERTERLAMKYGVAAEQVKEVQRNISVATSRQLMLNDAQAEQFLQLNKLVGSNTVSKFTEEMMNGMGAQIGTVQGAVSKAYATAAKSGLNAQKVSEKIASNLNMANKLSFRTGIEGLTRMAMKAEKIGMNLQSVEAAAEKFREIDQAIESSARLQMLGGNAAIIGANPLDMAYMANNDPEALQEAMAKMLGGYAQFDAQKGISNINGINMDFVRNIAQAMGISTEEASRIAKKNSEVKYKETQFGGQLNALGLNEEQKDFLINKSHIKNGQMMYTDAKGKEHNISTEGITDKILEEMMKYEGKSDRDIMEENARSLSSINEILTGIKDSIAAMFGKFISGMFPQFQGDLKKFGESLKNKLYPLAEEFGQTAREIYNWIKDNKDTLKKIASGIVTLSSLMLKYWPLTLAAIAASKLLNMGRSMGMGRGGDVGRGATMGNGGGTPPMSRRQIRQNAQARYESMRKAGESKLKSARSAQRLSVQQAGGYGKLAKTGARMAKGGGIAAIGGMVGGMATDYAVENGYIDEGSTTHKLASAGTRALEYGGTGAMIGGMIGSFVPVIGNAVGAAVGGAIGGIWGGISGLMDASEAGEKAKEGAKAATRSHDSGGFIDGFINSGAVGVEKPISEFGDTAQRGEAILNPTQQRNFMAIANGEATTKTASATASTTQISAVLLNPTQQRNFMAMANNDTTVKPKQQLGEKEYIYIPKGSESSNINGNTVTVKDFNININGTLKLDGGSLSKNLDIRELLNDREFVNALKDVVKTAINNDVNGGRYMNDLAVISGLPAQTAIYGR